MPDDGEHDSQLKPFLEEYEGWQAVTERLPNGLKTVVVLALINGGSNGLMAWAKGEWFAFAIMNLSYLVMAVLVLRREKKNDSKRKNPSQFGHKPEG